ncbi:hypothetical protein OH77DRAFT_909076 [Trametes cingulata]|nr:hypothetical protein OH77DRAFT_909076 [Trametes cingulata]
MDPRAVVGLGKRRGEDDWPVRRLYCVARYEEGEACPQTGKLTRAVSCEEFVQRLYCRRGVTERTLAVHGGRPSVLVLAGAYSSKARKETGGWIVSATAPVTKTGLVGAAERSRVLGGSLERRARAASRVPEKENDKDPISAAVGFIGQAL